MEDELEIYRTSYQEGQGVLKKKVSICVMMPSLFLYEFMFINLVTSFLVQSICIVRILFPTASAFLLPPKIQGGSNMTGTHLYVNKPHCAAAVRP